MANETGPQKSSDRVKKIFDSLDENERQEMLTLLKESEKNNITNLGESDVENGESPQELKDFRKAWRIKWKTMPEATIEKIVNAAEKINVKVETERDGSRLIEFSLNGKKYKILDPKLITHSDEKYLYMYDSVGKLIIPGTVVASGMEGDDVENWKNQKLKEYVKEKQQQGLHIPKIEEIQLLLFELGKQANLDLGDLKGKIGMLSYLTGMDGEYLLSMGNDKHSGHSSTRSRLTIDGTYANFHQSDLHKSYYNDHWQLCMFSCE